MKKTYFCKGGNFPLLYDIITKNGHTLIAGATGSGKSVLLNNIIYYLSATEPSMFILIDPKQVELNQWKKEVRTELYASKPKEILSALNRANATMEWRLKQMRKKNLKEFDGIPLYIFIDELAYMFLNLKEATPHLCNIATLGRAAKVFLIACTQRPTRDIIKPMISVNFTHKIALRTTNAQDSRNIIGINGAEKLPLYGQCIVQTPNYEPQLVNIKRLV